MTEIKCIGQIKEIILRDIIAYEKKGREWYEREILIISKDPSQESFLLNLTADHEYELTFLQPVPINKAGYDAYIKRLRETHTPDEVHYILTGEKPNI